MPAVWSSLKNVLGDAVAQGARRVAQRLEKPPGVRIAGVPGLRPTPPEQKEDKPPVHVTDPKALFEDPFSIMRAFGYKDRPSPVSYDTMREVVYRLPIISSIIQVRVEQVASFAHVADDRFKMGFRVKIREKHDTPTNTEYALCRKYERFLLDTGMVPNPKRKDSFEAYLRKIVRDALVFDQNCTELVPGNDGRPAEFYAIDAANVRIANNLRGMTSETIDDDVSYVEVWNETIRTRWRDSDIIFGVRNPNTDIRLNGYGTSELEYLMSTVTQLLNAINYNSAAFTNGTMARGILNVRDPDLDNRALNLIEQRWNSMIRGVENAWKTPVIAAKDGVEWINLQGATDQQFSTWMDFLIKVSCFPAGTPVTMGDGIEQPIESVEPGQNVLTHMGRPRRVLNKQIKNFNGNLVCLNYGGRTVRCTPEHPFYVRSSWINVYNVRVFEEPRWETADNLVTGSDYVLIPKPRRPNIEVSGFIDLRNYVDEEEYIEEDGKLRPAKSHRGVSVSAIIPTTEENAFIWGLYAAEGNASKSNITWSFHIKEREYVDAVHRFVDRIGLNFAEQDLKNNGTQAKCASAIFVKALRAIWGEKQINRRVPKEILHASDASIQAFLSGLIAGDGCVFDASGSVHLSVEIASCSEPFLRQVQHLFARLGVWSYIYRCRRGHSAGTFVNDQFSLRVGAQYLSRISSWLSGPKGGKLSESLAQKLAARGTKIPWHRRMSDTPAYFCLPISEVWQEPFDGQVHNMEVEGDNSYLAAGASVHNCASYKISPEEIQLQYGTIGQTSTLAESSNRDKITDSKERGLRPLLRHISGNINRSLLWPHSEDLEFEFCGLDAMTKEEQADYNTKRVSSWLTLNEIRAEEDLDPLPGGDIVLNGAYLQSKAQEQQAQAQGAVPGMDSQPVLPVGQQDEPSADTGDQEPAQDAPVDPTPQPLGAMDLLQMGKSQGLKKSTDRYLDIRL